MRRHPIPWWRRTYYAPWHPKVKRVRQRELERHRRDPERQRADRIRAFRRLPD